MKLLKIVYALLLGILMGVGFCSIAGNENSWAQRTLQKMSKDEKIGQLFMIAAYVDPEYANSEIGNPQIIQEIDHFITQYHVGGLAYVGPSESIKQVILSNHYQGISKYPLLIAQDLEWGLSMRLKDGMSFPKNITLGAINNNSLIYETGKEIGRQARCIGVHMNLSPVLDVNIEPENISINARSFGSSPQLVAERGAAMIQGLQDAGIIASAKHFPGLGDICIDPHLGLPLSKHTQKRLQEVELYPFVQAIHAGVLSIQTEHIVVPALGGDANTSASLSPKIVNDLLKKELGFKGLVLSGALRMKALTLHIPEEEIVLKAFLAGNDMLLMPQDFPKAYQIIKRALTERKITEKDLDERVLKILQMKERVGLDRQRIVAIPTIAQLHSSSAQALKQRLYKSALTLIRDHRHLVHSARAIQGPIAYIQLGDAPSSAYFETLSKMLPLIEFSPLGKVKMVETNDEMKMAVQQLEHYSLIILAVYPADPRRIQQIRLLSEKDQEEELKHFRVHGLSESQIRLINSLQCYQEKTIVTYFGNPFGLHFFDGFSTLLMAYEPDPDAQQAAANFLIHH